MKRALLAGTLLALSGCGLLETRETRDPQSRSEIIGMALPDLLSSLGKPDSVMATGPDTAVIQYSHVDTSAGLEASFLLLGSIKLGGGGGCRVVFTVLRSGTVADVAFPFSYSDNLFSAPYSACAPIISEPLLYPNSAGLPKGYDAFQVLFGNSQVPIRSGISSSHPAGQTRSIPTAGQMAS